MKFELKVTDRSYRENNPFVEILKDLGFTFSENKVLHDFLTVEENPHIEINTLEELMELKDKVENELVITGDNKIEIYNDYRE